MKTNDLSDPRLARQVLGRKRIRRCTVIAVPVRESIEYKIIQKKKELGMIGVPCYQVMMFGEWQGISFERYSDLQRTNQSLPVDKQFKLRLQ